MIRKWSERSLYPKFQKSFDYYWRQWLCSYCKPPDFWVKILWYDAFAVSKKGFIAIEYKASTNINKHTFSSYKDLDAELAKLKYIESLWWYAYVVIYFTEEKKCHIYTPCFISMFWDTQIDIDCWWITLPEIKSNVWDKIFDICPIIL